MPLVVVFLAFGSIVFLPSTSLAEPVPTDTASAPPTDADAGAEESSDETTCAIDKVGWILCPLIEKAGQVGDQAFQYLAGNFLATDPELVARFNGSGQASGTYTAWELARNIANILFIAAFLIIILAQVTGRGIDNYGIKKLLPKLIIAAIAVNISYFICQLMVDLTNVLGYEIQNFMVQTAAQVTDRVAMPPNTGLAATENTSGALGAIGVGAMAIAGVIWIIMPVLFLGVSTVVITCLVIIAILLMRKAFIVLLVVASPIAFVAYLLPNTEKYFQKWLSMFWQLLLVFPVVGLLFGGGQLASAIVLVAGTTQGTDANNANATNYKDSGNQCVELAKIGKDGKVADPDASVKPCGDGSTPFMLGLVAAGIAVAPLLAVWAVLKGALSAAGAIGGKIGGAIQSGGNGINRYARKPEDWLRRQALNQGKNFGKEIGKDFQTSALNGGFGRRTAGFVQNRKRSSELRDKNLDLAKTRFNNKDKTTGGWITEGIENAEDLISAERIGAAQNRARGLADGSIRLSPGASASSAVQDAVNTQMKRAGEEVVKAIKEGFKTTDIDGPGNMREAFRDALVAGDELKVKALVDMLAQSNKGQKAMGQVMAGIGMDGSHPMNDVIRQRIQTDAPGAKSANAAFKAWADNANPGSSLADNWHDASTWEKQIDSLDKFTALNADSQRQALSKLSPTRVNGLVDALKASPNAQTHLSDESRATLKTLGL